MKWVTGMRGSGAGDACELAGVPVPKVATLDEWLDGARRADIEHEWGSIELF
jgi:hypothetical protein